LGGSKEGAASLGNPPGTPGPVQSGSTPAASASAANAAPSAPASATACATGPNKDKAKYTATSDQHVIDHGHAADGKPQMVDKNATKSLGKTQYKSKFASGEGGQKFTDEVLDHPNTVKTGPQTSGRIKYENKDLGRVTGLGRDGNPVRGGEVIVEGPNPKPGASTGDVVTQYPAGNP
jgi:hypothetical protein